MMWQQAEGWQEGILSLSTPHARTRVVTPFSVKQKQPICRRYALRGDVPTNARTNAGQSREMGALMKARLACPPPAIKRRTRNQPSQYLMAREESTSTSKACWCKICLGIGHPGVHVHAENQNVSTNLVTSQFRRANLRDTGQVPLQDHHQRTNMCRSEAAIDRHRREKENCHTHACRYMCRALGGLLLSEPCTPLFSRVARSTQSCSKGRNAKSTKCRIS